MEGNNNAGDGTGMPQAYSGKDLDSAWGKVADGLEKGLGPVEYGRLLTTVRAVNFQNGVLHIGVPDAYFRNRSHMTYQEEIARAVEQNMRGVSRIEFVSFSKKGSNLAAPNLEYSLGEAHLSLEYSFDNFVITGVNEQAYKLVFGMASGSVPKKNVFLYGGVGLGKTHLMRAAGLKVFEGNHHARYLSAEGFLEEYKNALRGGAGADSAFRKRMRSLDFLALDNVEFLGGKEHLQGEFFNAFNDLDLYRNAWMIFASNLSPRNINGLDEKIVSRLEKDIVIEIKSPGYDDRLRFVTGRAKRDNVELDTFTAQFVAKNVRRGFRPITAAISRLGVFDSLGNDVKTLEGREEHLRGILGDIMERDAGIEPRAIIEAVAGYYNIKYDDVVGKKNEAIFTQPRHVAMYLVYDMLHLSLPQVKRIFNKKTHGAIKHAVDKIRDEISQPELGGEGLAKDVRELRQRLKAA